MLQDEDKASYDRAVSDMNRAMDNIRQTKIHSTSDTSPILCAGAWSAPLLLLHLLPSRFLLLHLVQLQNLHLVQNLSTNWVGCGGQRCLRDFARVTSATTEHIFTHHVDTASGTTRRAMVLTVLVDIRRVNQSKS